MYHVKTMIVDGVWTSVGLTNFDPRSLRLNSSEPRQTFRRGSRTRAVPTRHTR